LALQYTAASNGALRACSRAEGGLDSQGADGSGDQRSHAHKRTAGTSLEADIDTKRDTVVDNVKVANGNAVNEIKINAARRVAPAE
jgi:hypothetical protein